MRPSRRRSHRHGCPWRGRCCRPLRHVRLDCPESARGCRETARGCPESARCCPDGIDAAPGARNPHDAARTAPARRPAPGTRTMLPGRHRRGARRAMTPARAVLSDIGPIRAGPGREGSHRGVARLRPAIHPAPSSGREDRGLRWPPMGSGTGARRIRLLSDTNRGAARPAAARPGSRRGPAPDRRGPAPAAATASAPDRNGPTAGLLVGALAA